MFIVFKGIITCDLYLNILYFLKKSPTSKPNTLWIWFILQIYCTFKKKKSHVPPRTIPHLEEVYSRKSHCLFFFIIKKVSWLMTLFVSTDDFVCFHQGLVGNKTNIHTFFFFFFFLILKNYIKLVIYADIYKSNTSYDNITIYKY